MQIKRRHQDIMRIALEMAAKGYCRFSHMKKAWIWGRVWGLLITGFWAANSWQQGYTFRLEGVVHFRMQMRPLAQRFISIFYLEFYLQLENISTLFKPSQTHAIFWPNQIRQPLYHTSSYFLTLSCPYNPPHLSFPLKPLPTSLSLFAVSHSCPNPPATCLLPVS